MAFHPAMDLLVTTIRPTNQPPQTTGKDYRLNRLNATRNQAAENYRRH